MAETIKNTASATGRKTAASTEVKKTVRKKSTATTASSTQATAKQSTAKPATRKKAVSEPAAQAAAPTPKSVVKPKAPARKSSPLTETDITSKKVALPAISPEQRYQMIATAAYFIAEQRGFASGYELHDWFTAEGQINTQIGAK